MVITNVMEVLPDGTITELVLEVPRIIELNLKRTNVDELFQIDSVSISSKNEESLKTALREINCVLIKYDVSELSISDVHGNLATIII